VIRDLGYDFERGCQDLSPHPFMTRSTGGYRITTRYNPNFLSKVSSHNPRGRSRSLRARGRRLARRDTACLGTTHGVHETSRASGESGARSRPFWTYYYPKAQAMFPQQLKDISLDDFLSHQQGTPFLIRTEADELTYNLHVMIRFSWR